jgi:hypothetical protein
LLTIDDVGLAWYDVLLENRYLKAVGNDFQNLFVQIMERAHPGDFQAVGLWGTVGDLKCDGYLKSRRNVFACYGPHDFEPMTTCTAKVTSDHHGARAHWIERMSTWTLVHNARQGLPAPLVQLLLSFEDIVPPVVVEHWSLPELRVKVRALSHADLVGLFGAVPSSRAILGVRQADILRVVMSLTSNLSTDPGAADLRAVPPEKIEFNRLSSSARAILVNGMQVAGRVATFFQKAEPGLGERVAAAFKSRYAELTADSSLSTDAILWELCKFAGQGQIESTHEHAAVLALVAFLFESCEIFERPPAMTS